jgi:hypothetical protein
MTVRESHDAEPLESGDVFFLYRPRVDEAEVGRIEDIQRLFSGADGGERKFVDLDPPGFLDHAGVELVFVAASGDPHAELGLDLDAEDETAGSAETVRELGMDPGSDPTRPLTDSEWE